MPQIDRALSTLEDRLNAESQEAQRKCRQANRLVYALTKRELQGSSPWLATFAELSALVPPGIYELHKSTRAEPKLYTVLGVGDHTENGAFLVACVAHYAPHKGNLCFRPLLGDGGFLQPVYKGTLTELQVEYCVPRFKYIKLLPQSFEHFVELTTG